jgi:hypothetical protein
MAWSHNDRSVHERKQGHKKSVRRNENPKMRDHPIMQPQHFSTCEERQTGGVVRRGKTHHPPKAQRPSDTPIGIPLVPQLPLQLDRHAFSRSRELHKRWIRLVLWWCLSSVDWDCQGGAHVVGVEIIENVGVASIVVKSG